MENEINDEVIIDDVEANNEVEVTEEIEVTEKAEAKAEKPKRTPQEEYDYHQGRAERLAKKLGLKKPEVKKDSSEPSESINLDYGEKAFLKTYGIQGADELALVKNFASRTGDDLDTIVSDDIFLGKLNNLRQARESANAIPKGKNRSGQSAITDTDLAYAKYKETGDLPTDFATRNKVVDMIAAEEKGPMFNFK